jgi:hypothetical protein
VRMPDPRRVPPFRRPGPAPAEGAAILALHPAAETLLAALRVQVRTGRLVRSGQLSLESPCPGWSVRDVMNHSIGVTMKFAGFAAGGSDHPRTPPGDLVGRDHQLALRSAAGAARSAWASADMARPCHVPFGTFPASLAAGINLSTCSPTRGTSPPRPASRWSAQTSCGRAA